MNHSEYIVERYENTYPKMKGWEKRGWDDYNRNVLYNNYVHLSNKGKKIQND